MKVSAVQMTMRPLDAAHNFAHAEALIRRAAADGADVVVLPEMWNTGFVPAAATASAADHDGAETKARLGALARELRVNLMAGSVANDRGGFLTNTAYVFDRAGACIAEYDKVHLFTLMGEDRFFRAGSRAVTFPLDRHPCGVIICYDLRFPELARTLALAGAELLFVPAQWPAARVGHYEALLAARAIENECFVVGCNSCGDVNGVTFGGSSRILDPLGAALAAAGQDEVLLSADVDFEQAAAARRTIDVFRDRRSEVYRL